MRFALNCLFGELCFRSNYHCNFFGFWVWFPTLLAVLLGVVPGDRVEWEWQNRQSAMSQKQFHRLWINLLSRRKFHLSPLVLHLSKPMVSNHGVVAENLQEFLNH